MNATDYGGGTPVSDVWRRDAGIAVGHLERVPKLVSLPVKMPDASHATVARQHAAKLIAARRNARDLPTFVAVHQRDYFPALQEYRNTMSVAGVRFEPGAGERFRADLVRVGLWQDLQAGADRERAARR